MGRVVQPELLDELAFDDPEALRSRRDICMINRLMGNHRWLRNRVREQPARAVVELGAGHGALLEVLRKDGRRLAGVDLAPRPEGLPDDVKWVQGDVREVLEGDLARGAAVVANHLLHQFEDEELREMGRAMRNGEAILACEPLRSKRARAGLTLLRPVVNRVTIHDGIVSIQAGFQRGELPRLLGLTVEDWEIEECCTLRGAYRLSARRRRR